MTWQILDTNYEQAKIAIVGVGGGGGNTVQHIINSGVEGVEFICANTDAQALSMVQNAKTLKLGKDITKGLGAGNNPESGRIATEVCREEISDLLKNTQMLFVTAGMGGGTGTGGAPVIAKIAKELGILVVGVVTTPFKTEGEKRHNQAKLGITKLMEHVDSLIEIDNEKIFEVFPPDTPIEKAFTAVNDVLVNAVRGVANIVLKPSKINVDFADVRAVMSEKGTAMMGTGIAAGKNRAEVAATMAVKSELLDDINLKNARGVLVNITGQSPTLGDQTEVTNIVEEIVSEDALVIYGLVFDDTYKDDLKVTIVATGVDQRNPTLAIDNEPTMTLNPVGLNRNQKNQEVGTSSAEEIDFLDVPTFMRKQVD